MLRQYRNAAWHAAQFDALATRTLSLPQQRHRECGTLHESDAANGTELTTEDAVAYFKTNAFLPRMNHRDLNLLWQRHVGRKQDGDSGGVTRPQFLAMVGGMLASTGGKDQVSNNTEDSVGSRATPARRRAQTVHAMTAQQRGVADTAMGQPVQTVAGLPWSSPFPAQSSPTTTRVPPP